MTNNYIESFFKTLLTKNLNVAKYIIIYNLY